MNKKSYNEAWTRLLAARRSGTYLDVAFAAEELSREAKVLENENHDRHVPDDRGVCLICGYNSSQTPIKR